MNPRELEPKALFNYFADISEIPHGSYNTKQISDYLVNFAKERGLKYVQDEVENVIIYKDATAGYEHVPGVILQGHMDMVCEKVDGCEKDMATEGLDLYVDGDMLRARGTTLGGDDGAAVALMLALLDADNLEHPALECVFTVDEETGLEGAEGLDVSLLSGKMMLNLDSEEEGILTVSCAGGITADVAIPVNQINATGSAFTLTIDGLVGGHSGTEIHKEYANANILMGRALYELRKSQSLNIVDMAGGAADNVICKKCVATIMVEDADALKAGVEKLQAEIAHEYQTSDPDIKLTLTQAEATEMLDDDSTHRVLTYLMIAPYGVMNMSADIKDLTETSLNLGALAIKDGNMTGLYAVRSSVKTRQDLTCDKLTAVAELLGGSVEYRFYYPAWEYRADSPLRDVCVDVFKTQYDHEPAIEAIHAGLECGVFAGKMGDAFDAVSIGPDINDVHTPDETLSIPSTQRFWTYLCGILKETKRLG